VPAAGLCESLIETIRFVHQRGWAPGTGGNFSAVLSRAPLRLVITPSGSDKGRIGARDLIEIDGNGDVLRGTGAASAETLLHLAIVVHRGAEVVLHTHSVWNTLLSRQYAHDGELVIDGYEMLKGLQGVKTHEHREHLPILINGQDMPALSAQLTDALRRYPACHGVLVVGHGLYTWGEDMSEARRHVEIWEFLFEVVARERLRDARI